MTKFLIQINLMNEHQLQLVNQAVAQYPCQLVSIIPFSREIISDIPVVGTDYIPYGSTLLTLLGADLGWQGLFFDLNLMHYQHWLDNSPYMLNDGIMSASEAIKFLDNCQSDSEWFTRPSHDLKHYSGMVLPASEISDMLRSRTECSPDSGTYYLDSNTPILLDRPKTIQAEWRWFIVDGKIVTGSMYRAHGQLRKLRETDKAVISEAQELADYWLPCDTVVMDTCIVQGSDKLNIVEFNCINSSGFYDHDVSSVFRELWNRCIN